MCGRFTQKGADQISIDEIERLIGHSLDYHNALLDSGTRLPYRDVNVVFQDQDEKAKLSAMHWQLIRSFEKEFKSKYQGFNTRSEALEKPHNKRLVTKYRCIFPIDSFFEVEKKNGKPVKPSRKHEFRLKSKKPMMLGGIYSIWTNPNKKADRKYSCSIITLPPNEIIGEVHDRMPFIMDKQTIKIWLDHSMDDFELLVSLIKPIDSKLLERELEVPKG